MRLSQALSLTHEMASRPHALEGLLSKTIKGKVVSVLTSMTDPLRFPGDEIVDLYSQRWEIELGYREIKQRLLVCRLTNKGLHACEAIA